MSGRGAGTPIAGGRCRRRQAPHHHRSRCAGGAPLADDAPFQIVEKCSARGRPEKARSAIKRIETLGKGAIVKANGSESGRGKRRRVPSLLFCGRIGCMWVAQNEGYFSVCLSPNVPRIEWKVEIEIDERIFFASTIDEQGNRYESSLQVLLRLVPLSSFLSAAVATVPPSSFRKTAAFLTFYFHQPPCQFRTKKPSKRCSPCSGRRGRARGWTPS
jgi:hypothetical protein